MRNTLLFVCLLVAGPLFVGCSSSNSNTSTTDSGQGSGTDAETGGGTCTLATTCLGAFLGTCFDPSGSCSTTATGETFSNGAKLTKSGTTWTATSSTGATCYTIDEASGTFTFHVGANNLVMTTAGNQTRWTCPDGTPDNFTTAAFDESECAMYVPGASKCVGAHP